VVAQRKIPAVDPETNRVQVALKNPKKLNQAVAEAARNSAVCTIRTNMALLRQFQKLIELFLVMPARLTSINIEVKDP
jgi:hypothetical protein